MYSISNNTYFIQKNDKVFIYNSVNGEKIVCSKTAAEVIGSIDSFYNMMDSSLINTLLEKGIIKEEDEKKPNNDFLVDKDLIHSGYFVSNLRLNVTTGCNLRCKYCFENILDSYQNDKIMSWNIAKKSVDKFCELLIKNRKEKGSIQFFGGEPILNFEVVKKTIEYVEQKYMNRIEINFMINTNGILMTDDIAKYLKQHNVLVIISLDGVQEINDMERVDYFGKGSFNKVINGLRILALYRCFCNIAVVVTGKNIEHLKELIDYLISLKDETNLLFDMCFSFVHISNDASSAMLSAEEKVEKLMDAIKYARTCEINVYGGLSHQVFQNMMSPQGGKHCACLGGELSVVPNGRIYPCYGIDYELGHIDDIDAVLKGELYEELVERRGGHIDYCKGCPVEYYCGGGCYADFLSGDGKSKNTCRNKELEVKLFNELVKEYVL